MVAAMTAIVGFSGLVRTYPMLSEKTDLDGILDKTSGRETENDLLQFFINYENPIFNRLITNRVTSSIVQLPDPGRWNTSYLGYIPLLLIGWGITRKRYRRRMAPWLLLMAPFFLLRLGSVLTINGQEIITVVLPKYALDRIVPIVFEAFYSDGSFSNRRPVAAGHTVLLRIARNAGEHSKATTRRDRALAYRFVGGRILS